MRSEAGSRAAQGTLIVIAGPTGAGKTPIAAALARELGTEVVNADARQFYHALRVGAALPTETEMQGVPHHFVGHLDITSAMSAGAFEREAVPLIERLLYTHGTAVLTGGSGLYIDAVLSGFDALPAAEPAIREGLQARLRAEGLEVLLAELQHMDPTTWSRIDRKNPHRVIRALEVCLATGRPMSEQRTGAAAHRPWQAVKIALALPRHQLYARIDRRVDEMLANGLLEEARGLLPHRDANALRTVGYTELFAHFDGRSSLPDAVHLIKQHTRNYAKRQLTWLRRDTEWNWLPPEAVSAIHVLAQDRSPRSGYSPDEGRGASLPPA